LKQESTLNVLDESLNPIHRVWDEPSIIDPITCFPNFIIDRIAFQSEGKSRHFLVINQNNFKKLPDKYITKITERYHVKHTINDLDNLNKYIRKYYKKAIETNYKTIRNQCDYVIIESYADQALYQWDGLNHFDVVISVKP
jgi:predicted P-loop ATPase/GTPase